MAGNKEVREIRELIESTEYDTAFRKCKEISEKKGKLPPQIFYYGALSLFGLGHIRQAETWVENFERYSSDSVHALYLKAYQSLHRGKTDEALLCYTRILERDPSDTFADSLIERLRRGEKSIQRELEIPENFRNYFPGFNEEISDPPMSGLPRSRDGFRPAVIFFIFLGVLLIGIAAYTVPKLFEKKHFSQFHDKLPEMPSSGSVIPADEYVDERPRFIYESSKDALKDYAAARNLILDGRVNSALRTIGKIELSNAGFEIKERATLLREFIPFINPDQFQDHVTIEEILSEPFILRGAQVIWSGKAVSVQKLDERRQRIIFSEKEMNQPPFVVFDVIMENGELIQKGEKITVFGMYDKILTGEMVQIKTLKILKRDP
ncbi:MAG: hypothetical protein OEZ34_02900 [Spirochaetia bacterium]|nr:hypothetical protein [Spirochaetia bacterium]